jgi:hypothetical protein
MAVIAQGPRADRQVYPIRRYRELMWQEER